MKLTRSRKNRMLAGVLGGMAESFGMSPTLLRILFVILTFSTAFFPMTMIYLVLVFVLPNREGY
ncbi:PspC domain-containing protein [Mesobacillus selenatarsenatis]|uniref:Putative stress-responsive transcriptional regulator n=1 Tax=Mesobacillus selenatarsenatis (strain DSM 18680 / JCM 14380 / FERM P-15431 / SF-1) TaxID=1321606 RepID=A0A0A8X772_MESS1|nr:PspC domain-containing protein [Mesobacillus selenatarsenatis]GAM15810.1 putative stress-responsive transcriptional regulator [Mesobacillus selenatarsenatis SF-1]